MRAGFKKVKLTRFAVKLFYIKILLCPIALYYDLKEKFYYVSLYLIFYEQTYINELKNHIGAEATLKGWLYNQPLGIEKL